MKGGSREVALDEVRLSAEKDGETKQRRLVAEKELCNAPLEETRSNAQKKRKKYQFKLEMKRLDC